MTSPARSHAAGPGIQTVPITNCAVSLDMTRIYADAYERAGRDAGLIDAAARQEADEEFTGEDRPGTGGGLR